MWHARTHESYRNERLQELASSVFDTLQEKQRFCKNMFELKDIFLQNRVQMNQ